MEKGHFYFIKNQYFVDFPDTYLMKNKEFVNGRPHGRPCFFAYLDIKTNIYWMVPISSQVEKYKGYYQSKIKKHGSCDTIMFGYILGHEKAFLIQNICPVTEAYIDVEYTDNKNSPVRIDKRTEEELIKKVKKVIALQRKGIKLIFPDVLDIEAKLL